jgi:hypothetical protein
MNAQPRIFLAGHYSYRKPAALIAGFVAILFGTYAILYLFFSIHHTTWSVKPYAAVTFVGGIGSALLLCGFILLRRWILKTSLTLEISNLGVRYGETFHSWSEIHWISGRADRKRMVLFYQTRERGLAGYDRPLPLDCNPTAEEFHHLLETLDMKLSKEYPNVQFG